MTEPTLQLLGQSLWATREAKCLAIIKRALSLLQKLEHLPESEVELNRKLYFFLLVASRELYPEDETAPIMECNNQPDPNDDARAKREQKRPDFQWIYLDRYAVDPTKSSRQFVVECKRLGKPSRPDWILNLNYSHHGIARFRDDEWSYAKLMHAGVMIGYLQNMREQDVLQEVNEGCRSHSLPDLVLTGSWQVKGVSHLAHKFERAFDISPFNLTHLWADLRD